MTATQAIDLVKKKITGRTLHRACSGTADSRTKLLQRLAGLKAFKKLHGPDCDLEEVPPESAAQAECVDYALKVRPIPPRCI
jgi:hypothetical protein